MSDLLRDRIIAHRSAPDVYDPPTFEQMASRIAELEAKLAKAVEALGVLADDTNWFDAVEEDGTFSAAWRGTGSPDEIASATLAELTGGKDGC